MAEKDELNAGRILGDINPRPGTQDHRRPRGGAEAVEFDDTLETDESMVGGSRHDRDEHPGSRDVTEGVTGGTGTETGGSRNYRTGTGATGGDIGNRPE